MASFYCQIVCTTSMGVGYAAIPEEGTYNAGMYLLTFISIYVDVRNVHCIHIICIGIDARVYYYLFVKALHDEYGNNVFLS